MTDSFRGSAAAYDRHVGRYGAQLADAFIGFAGVARGMRALDVGCGPGALTAALAARLQAANVRAADPSEPFVEACGARLPGVEVVVAAAEALPFADGTFDATLSQLVVNFMRDGLGGVREMARVTRSGGVVATTSGAWPCRTPIAGASGRRRAVRALRPRLGRRRHRRLTGQRPMARPDEPPARGLSA